VELQMCQDFVDCGECFHYRCPRAHGEAELRQREREWTAQQEARKQEAARRQAQAVAAAQAKAEEEQALQAQIASLETHSREALGLPGTAAPAAWGTQPSTHAPPAAAEPAMRLTDASLVRGVFGWWAKIRCV
jgi:Na+-translocating ferredoxin:NAD+ oxidoreductase RnfC subunit